MTTSDLRAFVGQLASAALLSLVYPAASHSSSVGSSGRCPIHVEVYMERKGGEIDLNFNLRNVSSRAVELYPQNIPWMNSAAINVVLLPDTRFARPLPSAQPVDVPPPGKVKIEVGGDAEGVFRVSSTHDRLEEVISDLWVFWTYSPRFLNGERCQFGGVILAPRS